MKKATRQHTKQHNRDLVLRTIFARESISRAETNSVISGSGMVTVISLASPSPAFRTSMSKGTGSPTTKDVARVLTVMCSAGRPTGGTEAVVKLISLLYAVPAEFVA